MLKSQKLNFYSRYNRVKQQQDIESLYCLLYDADQYMKSISRISLSGLSPDEDSKNNSPIKQYETVHNETLPEINRSHNRSELHKYNYSETEKDAKYQQMEQKLLRLERLEKVFQENMMKTLKEKKLRKKSKLKVEAYINVEDKEQIDLNQNSDHQSHVNSRESSSQLEKETVPPPHFDSLDPNVYKKLANLIDKRPEKEQYVESVESNQSNELSSIVLERLIQPEKLNHELEKKEDALDKEIVIQEHKNYLELELNHSQSEDVINQNRIKSPLLQDLQQIHEPGLLLHEESQEENGVDEINFQYLPYVDEKRRKVSDYDEFKEEIADQVEEIDDEVARSPLTPNNLALANPNTFLSQAVHRKTLYEEKEVQSLDSSLLHQHPFDPIPFSNIDLIPVSPHNDPLPFQFQEGKGVLKIDKKDSFEKKISFKKMMLNNRRELNPRLVTSTILNNDHANQNHIHLEQLRNMPHSQSKSNISPATDIKIPSEKVNFKQKYIKISNSKDEKDNAKKNNQNASPMQVKKSDFISENGMKSSENKKLLKAFFQLN